MHKKHLYSEVEDVLDSHLRANKMRRTPERYAVLKAMLSFDDHFTVEMLNNKLNAEKFSVSRATLYNTLALFIKFNIVVRHKMLNNTTYEVAVRNESHCHQVCTMCGRVTEVVLPRVEQAVQSSRLKYFRKEGFALYIYGICSSCAAKITRKRNHNIKKQQ